ncbi:MAG: hypothetical protein KGI71_03605 [Patescibacteria group bacterium]|nr:hypothetical protein [Patescibacteria group bacterium]
MRTVENRPVTVFHCDGCGEEASYNESCAMCHKEYCMEEGGKRHFAYSIEIYRYADAQRRLAYVCTTCADEKPDLTVKELLDNALQTVPPGHYSPA